MFLFDFILGDVLDDIIDWIYGKIIGFFTNFFSGMGNMGVELFEINAVKSIVLFFSNLAWSLFIIGIVVAVFETAIEYQTGRGNIKNTMLNILKGFLAVSLFSIVPVRLYTLSVQLQQSLTRGITGYDSTLADLTQDILNSFGTDASLSGDTLLDGFLFINNPFLAIFVIIMIGYAVIKVFFDNIKRGGVLLIQIAVGSLYMFSVPRGYMDGFIMWCKQVVALCLTSFLQVTILTAGLMVMRDSGFLGIGLMLSSGEIPKIAGAFGLDTSAKGNFAGAVHTANMAVNLTRQVTSIVTKT